MNLHLSRDALLALVEGAAADADRRHMAACARCREEVESLALVLASVRRVDVPEPSPLFWDHLSARVRDAVADEPVPGPHPRGARDEALPWWRRWGAMAWPAGLGVAAAALVALLVVGPQSPDTPGADTSVASLSADATDVADSPDDGEAWDFLVAVASTADASAGTDAEPVTPGSAERAVDALSGVERQALAALLESELRRSGDS